MRIVLCCSLPLCVVMGMVMSERVDCFSEPIDDVMSLQGIVRNGTDIKLYCPDLVVIENCQKETLECFNTELSVLAFEYDGTKKEKVAHFIRKLNYSFDHFLSHLNASKSCRHCEVYEEETAEIFLKNLLTVLHYHNRHMCSKYNSD